MHRSKSSDRCAPSYNLAEGHSLIVISALFISSWPHFWVCLSWRNCQHNDCSLPVGNVSALLSSPSAYVNKYMTVCISSGKSDWRTCLFNMELLLEMRGEMKKRTNMVFSKLEFRKKLYTYYTDSFFPCIRLDIHRNSWPPNPYRSLHFYTDPFHIHWHLQNTYSIHKVALPTVLISDTSHLSALEVVVYRV